MNGESIFGCIIMMLCSFGCGFTFIGIGIWAKNSQKPMHFYSGSSVDANTISDIKAYNKENAVMWKTYSVPYIISGLCAVAGLFFNLFSYVAIALIFLAATVGIGWLVCRYHRIQKRYKVENA